MDNTGERYEAVRQLMFCEDAGSYVSYGIRYSGNGKSEMIPDISPDALAVKSLAALFNSEHLASCHFRDAVEDFVLG